MSRQHLQVRHVVVLAGGRGSRIASHLAPGMPKQLLTVGRESIVERLIRQLHRTGERQVHLVVPPQSAAWTGFRQRHPELGIVDASTRSKAGDMVKALAGIHLPRDAVCVVMGDCVFDDAELARFVTSGREGIDLVVGVRPRQDKPREAFAYGPPLRLGKNAQPGAWPLAGIYLLSAAGACCAIAEHNALDQSITLLLDRLLVAGMTARRRLFRAAHDVNSFDDYLACVKAFKTTPTPT